MTRTAIFSEASGGPKLSALAARYAQTFLLVQTHLFAGAPRFNPRFPNLDLPQPLQNLFELGPNLFNPFISIALARTFFVFTFLG